MLMHNVCFHVIKPDGRPEIYIDTDVISLDTSGIGNCGIAGINTLNISTQLTLYPNPTTGGSIFVECSDGLVGGTIKLMTIEGRTLKSIFLSANTQQIDINDLPAGIYIILLTKNDQSISRKLVKI
jgi:hypothetical protein